MTMSQPTIFRRPSQQQQDLVAELRQFIAGATFSIQCPPLELLKTAIYLLKNLPASRDAVLQYFSYIFESVVDHYVLRLGNDKSTGTTSQETEFDEAAATEINNVLSCLVTESSVAWVPIICSWCLELLGNISSKYSGKIYCTGNLNESLQLWMNCRATKALIEITTQCLSSLMTSDTETCIQSLLDTSVKHSPHFDWVVAHVGSCFPQTVITRVLSCGLKDFYQYKSYEQVCQSAKLKSVVGILGHLAKSHSDDLKDALMDIFKLSLETTICPKTSSEYEDGILKQATLPYFLQLAKLSNTILSAICSNIKECLTVDIILKLHETSNYWNRYFGNLDIMREIIISLLPNCTNGGSAIFKLLLDCGNLNIPKSNNNISREDIKNNATFILEYIIQELDTCIRDQTTQNSQTLPIIKSLVSEINVIENMLISENALNCRTAAKIIILIGHLNPSLLIESVSYLFKKSCDNFHLSLVIRIITDELIDKNIQPYASKDGHFSVILEHSLGLNNQSTNKNDPESDFGMIILNLKTLLRWEASKKIYKLQGKPITKGIIFNLVPFTAILNNGKLSTENLHIMCEILEIIFTEKFATANLKLQSIVNIVNGFVDYFFIVCSETDATTQCKGFRRICFILQSLSTESKIARNLAIRSILDKALFGEEALLFGAIKDNNHFDDNDLPILKQNKKISKAIQLTKHSSVYNGGIIGNGRRKSICHFPLPPTQTITSNTQQLIRVLLACCTPLISTEQEQSMLNATDNNSDHSLVADVQTASGAGLLMMDTGTSGSDGLLNGLRGNGGINKEVAVLDSMTWLSLLLVQFVSPDVMYNGLPWPEEEFSKVTIERDLHIRRLFTTTPLLWDLLSLVAVHRPTLCYSSVLLRALMATILHQWTSMGDQSKGTGTGAFKQLMQCTIRVLDVMALGQLLPPPLCSVRDVVPYLSSYEIVAVLRDCIWAYMRDCVPSPALFSQDAHGGHWRDPTAARPPPPYTDTLRIIMQRNIACTPLGQLYGQLFITLPKD